MELLRTSRELCGPLIRTFTLIRHEAKTDNNRRLKPQKKKKKKKFRINNNVNEQSSASCLCFWFVSGTGLCYEVNEHCGSDLCNQRPLLSCNRHGIPSYYSFIIDFIRHDPIRTCFFFLIENNYFYFFSKKFFFFNWK